MSFIVTMYIHKMTEWTNTCNSQAGVRGTRNQTQILTVSKTFIGDSGSIVDLKHPHCLEYVCSCFLLSFCWICGWVFLWTLASLRPLFSLCSFLRRLLTPLLSETELLGRGLKALLFCLFVYFFIIFFPESFRVQSTNSIIWNRETMSECQRLSLCEIEYPT